MEHSFTFRSADLWNVNYASASVAIELDRVSHGVHRELNIHDANPLNRPISHCERPKGNDLSANLHVPNISSTGSYRCRGALGFEQPCRSSLARDRCRSDPEEWLADIRFRWPPMRHATAVPEPRRNHRFHRALSCCKQPGANNDQAPACAAGQSKPQGHR